MQEIKVKRMVALENMENRITLQDISKVYGMGETRVKALDHVSLTVEKGEFVTIAGQSGSGKSTLMNILGCLDTPTSGEYRLWGMRMSDLPERRLSRIRNMEIGFVFQGFNLIPGLTARENVELPLRYRGIRSAQRKKLAEEALEQVGLSSRMEHKPGQMSGGQQQRVAIARAIAARPPVILADEPTGNLDTASGEAVMEILRELHREGRTIILITHDPRIAGSAHRLIKMRDGKICT